MLFLEQFNCYFCAAFEHLLLKNFLSIFFAALILFQSFGKVWIWFSFKVNQDYIAKALCINRNKPEMHCNGKCILAQRIKAEEEKERKEIPQKLKEQKQVLYCFYVPKWRIEPAVDLKSTQKTRFSYQSPFTSVEVKGIFHPPRV